MIFSKNVQRQVKDEMLALWGIIEHTQHDKYLRFLLVIKISKSKTFTKIKRKVWQKLQTWKENLLS